MLALTRDGEYAEFGGLQEEIIGDQIVMHTGNPNIQGKLWVNGEAPLKEVIALVKKVELMGRCVKAMEEDVKDVKRFLVTKGEKLSGRNDTKTICTNQKEQ
ncbi:hypothetical protein NDU88_006113 [Pleurodeles waltl]|uniref:Uncharacterized protein n=1 Tax=Pleurodeles waltl TaxID=8319 RepID=A0AAV7LTW7_PLEWA|nr:hypothetical protein NDU88_006113 [Pleurodeles waltl]